MKRRLYKSGSRWAFFRWTFTPSGYITRLFLAHTPWGGVMVHFINGPDPEPDPHNHPVTFLSLILRGGYIEKRVEFPLPGIKAEWFRRVKWFNFVRAGKHIHSITHVWPVTITLAFYGPKRLTWSFFTPDGQIPWKTYNEKYRPVLPCYHCGEPVPCYTVGCPLRG